MRAFLEVHHPPVPRDHRAKWRRAHRGAASNADESEAPLAGTPVAHSDPIRLDQTRRENDHGYV
jgi:hypothetical protein